MIAPINLSSVISILFFILVSPSASASVKSSSKAPKSPKTVSSPSSSLSSPRDVHSKTIAFPSTLIHTNVSSSKARGQSVTLRKGNGVYNPSCKYGLEVFAGAWMMPSSRFTTATTRRLIDSIAIIEDHVFQTVMGGRYLDYPSCVDATRQVLMSRDYFDFFIEHSSSTLNMKESKDIDMLLLNRTSKKSKQLKDVGLSRERAKRSQKADLYFWNTTVAVIPFATVSGLGNEVYDVDRLMREAIFEMTFWSIYRYFPSIVVSVTTEYDFKALKKLNLPILQIFYKKDADPNFKPANVKFALQATHDAFAAKPEWRSKFKFVYFTEGDSVLHMRFQKTLYDLMSGVGERGGYVLVPHRMQTIPIPQNLPKDSQSIPAWKRKALSNVTLISESLAITGGSCCDDGRYRFESCKNWWYNCPKYGLSNLTTFFRFGAHGFTMSITEHMGRCTYSKHRRTCDVNPGCSISNRFAPPSPKDMCTELASIESSDPAVPSIVFHHTLTEP